MVSKGLPDLLQDAQVHVKRKPIRYDRSIGSRHRWACGLEPRAGKLSDGAGERMMLTSLLRAFPVSRYQATWYVQLSAPFFRQGARSSCVTRAFRSKRAAIAVMIPRSKSHG